MTKDDSIKNLQEKIIKFRDDRGWGKHHNPKDLAISVALEASELLECFQWKTKEQIEEYVASEKSFEIHEEMADVLIYLLQLSHVLDLDLLAAAHKKMEKNAIKHPIKK
jgi:NTP pyrophosphatase (non-canonical NTP hydrolase)